MKKEKILDISVIIPVHSLEPENTFEFLQKAIESVEKQKNKIKGILLVVTNEVLKHPRFDEIKHTIADKNIVYVVNEGETDFCSQINFGVSKCHSKYFSILELDDEYSNIYFENVEKYMNAYPNISAFLPVSILVDTENRALQYVNEAVWAQGFGEQLGQLDMTALLQYDNFIICGGVFTKESFEEVGGLKPNIKLYFNYEFLLRYVNSDFNTMVIPKLGYKHLVDRDGSLFKSYKDPVSGITPDEARFYLGAAKKEYFFNPNEIPRDIRYSPMSVV